MMTESKRFKNLGYYVIRHNNNEIFYEKFVEDESAPYFKRIHINLDYSCISASKCYITETKWKQTGITDEEVNAVWELIKTNGDANRIGNN